MSKIKQAPDGERTVIDGTEALPLSSSDSVSSWWTPISRILEYVRTAAITFTNKTLTAPTIADFTNAIHDHQDNDDGGTLAELALALTDITTNNSSTSKHGFLPKLSGDSDNVLNGDGEWITLSGSSDSDTVTGVASSTNNAVALWNGTSGHQIKNSNATYDSDGFNIASGLLYKINGIAHTHAESEITFTDITTNNADSDSHGYLLKLNMDTQYFLRGDGSWAIPPASGAVSDSDVVFSDITTNNSSTSKHGFLPKLSGDSDQYLDGDGEWRAVSTSPWTQTVNESGTTFTNWTATAGGTWSSDGTVIKQTETSATRRRATYNNDVACALVLVQADIQLRTSGGDNRAGLLMGFDGTNGGSSCAVFIDENNSVQVEVDAVANKYSHSITINVNTWYTLRCLYSGHSVSVWLDGTLLFTAGGTVQALNTADFVGLLTYAAEAWFRNIKVWNLTLPA